MLELHLPLVIPSYMCFSRHFENFVGDLSSAGIDKVIVLHDFVFSVSDILSHRRSVKELRKFLTPIFKSYSMKFKIISNALLEPKVYSFRELCCLTDKKLGYYFLTLPLSVDQSVAMKNIFTVKNAGFYPVICSFESVSVIFKKSFCEALLTTENISVVLDTDSLCAERTNLYLNKALSSRNTVLFSVSHFTTSVIERDVSAVWNGLESSKKMNLGYLSRRFSNHVFK